jgi:protein-S-isoprenylcysteine O-methyltransferase Ste14
VRRRVPRAAALIVQGVAFPAVFVGLPVALSRHGERHGWSAGRPGAPNLVGVLPLCAGAALLAWATASHNRAAPEGWPISLAPDYLLKGGPYRFSRNPMYIGEAAIWAGWAIVFGSLPVAGGLAVLTAIQTRAVRLEEWTLHKRWGDAYDVYRERVPTMDQAAWRPPT